MTRRVMFDNIKLKIVKVK